MPQYERDTDDTVLPEGYQRITGVVRRAEGPVVVKQVCTELEMSIWPTMCS